MGGRSERIAGKHLDYSRRVCIVLSGTDSVRMRDVMGLPCCRTRIDRACRQAGDDGRDWG
jgi:hypothetical protein